MSDKTSDLILKLVMLVVVCGTLVALFPDAAKSIPQEDLQTLFKVAVGISLAAVVSWLVPGFGGWATALSVTVVVCASCLLFGLMRLGTTRQSEAIEQRLHRFLDRLLGL